MDIRPTAHSANQADGKTKLDTCGEVHVVLTRGDISLSLQAVVVRELNCDILGGVPFMRENGIVLDLPKDNIIIAGKHKIPYFLERDTSKQSCRSVILRPMMNQLLYPGDYVDVQADIPDLNIAVEPRSSSYAWIQPSLTRSICGHVRIPNLTEEIVTVSKHEHIAQMQFTTAATELNPRSLPSHTDIVCASTQNRLSDPVENIIIDPDKQLSTTEIAKFHDLHTRYHNVFSTRIGTYNDSSGPIRASINMGPVEPPTQKARLPYYNTEKMQLLQQKMDELESLGVLAKPEDVGVTIEHVSPSFLVHKPDGSYRLVTAFNAIGTYAKPHPSRSVCTDDILRFLACHKFIIKTDMTKQFFQLPMAKESMKYLGVLTPYKGLRVYTRAAMGMPGSTEHLDELMSRVLGDLLQKGKVIKLADDLYTGGDNIDELLTNWEEILQRFESNNLRLSSTKTEICPVTTTILGWVWTSGTIAASPHKVSPLASASPPATVKGLRSWIGAYKHLKSCIPQYSALLSELEGLVAGKDSRAKIDWSEELCATFHRAQSALTDIKTITVPKPQDKLIITNDGAVKCGGIGAVLYVMRGDNMLLGGFYSAKLKAHQRKWLPCEVEALAIGAAVNHWSPYILENHNTVQILTDSRPCVQAYKRLCQGQFSHSARVSTFLSTLSRFNVAVQHIPGNMNIVADFQSRNPAECNGGSCQICRFVSESVESICRLQVSDILEGKCPMPYSSPAAWKATQHDCPALRRTFAHLSQGTRPSKKSKGITDTRRYMSVCSIGRDGLVVVRKEFPFAKSRDLIVIPSNVLPGLVSALHLRLHHPSKHQLSKAFHRYFYAINADKVIADICSQCNLCSSVALLPQDIEEFTTSDIPRTIGTHFACDVLRRANQFIFVIRDEFSSFTITRILQNEKSDTLRDAIIETTAELRSPQGCTIRSDGALQSLKDDKELSDRRIAIDIGRLKNRNKNPVAEKAISELETELKKALPDGRTLDPCKLASVTAILNNRLRNRGLSVREIILQRDGNTGEQLNITDTVLANMQNDNRVQSHEASARSQAKTTRFAPKAVVSVGDLVYVKSDGDKHNARDKYIVTSTTKDFLFVRKLIGHQFRSKTYKLKYTEVYHVPNPGYPAATHRKHRPDSTDTEADHNDHNISDSQETLPETEPESDDSDAPVEPNAHEPVALPRRSTRLRRQPTYLKDYELEPVSESSSSAED